MIAAFADREAEKIFRGEISRKLPREMQDRAREKLLLLDAMTRIEDLWAFPSLRLEKLSGNRKGQWSIRINQQWRICFAWDADQVIVTAVEITDYH